MIGPEHNARAVEVFCDLMDLSSYKDKPDTRSLPLIETTFWCGAGFSMAWQPKAPSSDDLFQLPRDCLDETLEDGAQLRLLPSMMEGIDKDRLKQLLLSLDLFARYPAVTFRYFDPVNIEAIRNALTEAVLSRLKDQGVLDYVRQSEASPAQSLTDDQHAIIDFFRHMSGQADGSRSVAEGMRSHFLTTNYDFVIETILRHVHAPDDPFELITYRGFTPIRYNGGARPVGTHDHWLVRSLIKLNGGAEIFRDEESFSIDYRASVQRSAQHTPCLILPSTNQDYTNAYFSTVFPKAIRLIRDTKVLVIVGYSLPEEDMLLRFILRQFCEEPEDSHGKFMFHVGRADDAESHKQLKSLFHWNDMGYWPWPKMHFFNEGFAAFARDCLNRIKTTA